jgi:ferrous iron transport protein B
MLPAPVERAISEVGSVLPSSAIAQRARALMALTGDAEVHARLGLAAQARSTVAKVRHRVEEELSEPIGFVVARARLAQAAKLAARVTQSPQRRARLLDRIGGWTTHAIFGWPILAGVLWLMYLLVGTFGAGTVVEFVESVVFGRSINPAVIRATEAIPFSPVRDFLVGDYGLITIGLTYAVAIILPIATFFFLAFAVLEDSGYLPRLCVMLDRVSASWV